MAEFERKITFFGRIKNFVRNLSLVMLIFIVIAVIYNAVVPNTFQINYLLFGLVGLVIGYLFLVTIFEPDATTTTLLLMSFLAVTVVFLLMSTGVLPKISASLLGNAGDFMTGGLAKATSQLQSLIVP